MWERSVERDWIKGKRCMLHDWGKPEVGLNVVHLS